MLKILYLIPARGGSKGIPGKNIKKLSGKELILYAIDTARKLTTDDCICVSTDDESICKVVLDYGLHVPFIRPATLSTDESSTYDVIVHALEYFKGKNISFDCVVLLQPTSPFRTVKHVQSVLDEYTKSIDEVDMVVTVAESDENPYYTLFEDNELGFLIKSKPSSFTRRQELPKVYKYNGAVYAINVNSIYKHNSLSAMKYVKKVVMDRYSSLDIDEPIDWLFCEMLINEKIIKINL